MTDDEILDEPLDEEDIEGERDTWTPPLLRRDAPERTGRAVLAGLTVGGALVGIVLGWSWRSDDELCLGAQCLAPSFNALAMGAALAVVLAIALWALRVLPPILSVALAGAIGILVTWLLTNVWIIAGWGTQVPLPLWAVVGAVALPAAYLMVRDHTPWRTRIAVLGALVVAVIATSFWGASRSDELAEARLDELGIDRPLVVTIPDYQRDEVSVRTARDIVAGTDSVRYLDWVYVREGAAPIHGGLAPLSGRDACEVAIVVEPNINAGECRVGDGELLAASTEVHAVGRIDGDTLTLLVASPDSVPIDVLRTALDEASSTSLSDLVER